MSRRCGGDPPGRRAGAQVARAACSHGLLVGLRAAPRGAEEPATQGTTARLAGAQPVSAAPGHLDRSDVDLSHLHHRFENALGRRAIGVGQRVNEDARRDLPRQTPPVLAPAALALLAAVSDDRVPQAVGFCLIIGGDLEREGLAVLELRPTVQADARGCP